MLILQPCFTALPPNKFLSFRRAKPLHHAGFYSGLLSPVTRMRTKTPHSQLETNGFGGRDDEELEDAIDVSWAGGGFGGRQGEDNDYDKDPEFAEIMGSCLDDPDKAKSKMEERLRKKRNKILHTKTGSANPMKVHFNKYLNPGEYQDKALWGWDFGGICFHCYILNDMADIAKYESKIFVFSNSYIWLEFYNAPLEQDISLISDTIRSWHIVGRLGGCNSMNMQLSQASLDMKPSYDAIQGANVTPTTFYNIGDLEVQHNLARIWVDIGTVEPLLLDILINALTQLSSDYVGIKQVMFGGSEFEGWEENLKSEDVGYNVHKI